MKKAISFLALLIFALTLTSCGGGVSGGSTATVSKATVPEIDLDGMDLEFTDNDLKSDYSDSEITDAKATDGIVKITSDGVYRVSGNIEQIRVEADSKAKPHILLENADISCENGPAIYITQADKVFITVPSGSESSLSDGASYDSSYENADGVIFSKADLTLNGSGALKINGSLKCGIVSKDDLVIADTKITVSSAGTAIEGKDCVKIKNADITLNAGTDGIKSTRDDSKTKGFVYVSSGTFALTAQNDAVQAETALLIDGGEFTVKTGGGSENSSKSYGKENNSWGHWGRETESDGKANTATDTASAKGLKSGLFTRITGGKFNINSSDDAIHSNGDTEINGGEFSLSSGDDGIHSDDQLIINNGTIVISQSYEGIEATEITVNNGKLDITSDDDGINAAGGNDSSSVNGRPGQNPFESDSEAQIYINGGYILVNASGDGIDSNGDITMNGGTLLVSGPEDSGNGALDYGGTAVINGGTAVITGSSGMAVTFSDESEQASFMYNTEDFFESGSYVSVTSSDKVIASFLSPKKFNSIIVSSPELKLNKSYTLNVGGKVSDCDSNGFTSNGTVTEPEKAYEITISSISVSNGKGYNMGGMGGRPDGSGGKRPDSMPDKPDNMPDEKPDGKKEIPEISPEENTRSF